MFYDGTGRLVRLTDSATGQISYRMAPDFEWNATTNRAQIRIQLAGKLIAVHDTAHDPNVVPPSCSGSPSALTPVDPAGFVWLFAPGLAALLGLALLQARRRRAEAGLPLSPGWGVSARETLTWRVGVAAATAGVFVLVISIPVPLLGPGRGTASAVSPPSVTYYHGDHLGSSVVLTRASSNPGLLRHVLYRPYGGVIAETPGGSTEPPEVGFTGQRFEDAAGIYNYGARWYDPELGRFLQPDAIVPEPFNPQSLNRYSYVMNDPVNHIDPTGNKFYFTGGSTYSGSIYGTDYGYNVFAGSGTHYYAGGGGSSSSRHQSAPNSEGLPQSQLPSGITAEPFTFAQTIPVQLGPTASQWTQTPSEQIEAQGVEYASLVGDGTPTGNTLTGIGPMIFGPVGIGAGAARAGALTNPQVRALYRARLSAIRALDVELAHAGARLRERALRAFQARLNAKLEGRALMADRVLADSLPPAQSLSDLIRKGYQEGLRGDDIWRSILESSTRSNKGVDTLIGGP